MPYYAVSKGRIPGVYNTWKECQKQTKGFSKASYKKFDSLEEAQEYVKGDNKPKYNKTIQLWTDGSAYSGKSAGYGFLFVDTEGKSTYEAYGKLTTGPFESDRAEIVAAIEGLRTYEATYEPGTPLEVYSDCNYLVNTLNEWGKTWGNDWSTRANADLLHPLYLWFKDKDYISVKHVYGHSGVQFNERCDQLAKLGSSAP